MVIHNQSEFDVRMRIFGLIGIFFVIISVIFFLTRDISSLVSNDTTVSGFYNFISGYVSFTMALIMLFGGLGLIFYDNYKLRKSSPKLPGGRRKL